MRTYVAVLLILGMTPSLEIAENVVHVVTEGHLAHAVDDEEHEAGPEHGCSGTLHICACHTSPVFVAVEVRVESTASGSAQAIERDGPALSDGHSMKLLRPPIV